MLLPKPLVPADAVSAVLEYGPSIPDLMLVVLTPRAMPLCEYGESAVPVAVLAAVVAFGSAAVAVWP